MRLLAAVILFAASSAMAAVSLTDAQRDWLRQHGKLVFVADTNYPPYTFGDDDARGLDADVARAIGRVLGVDVEVRPAPWTEALRLVRAGEADALAGMAQSPERAESWTFIEPHSDVQYFLFVRDDLQTVHEVKDLEGTRVGVGKGSLVEPILRANPKITVLNYGRDQGMTELLNREITAFAGNLVVQSYFVEKHTIKGVKVVGNALLPAQPYGIVVPPGHDELAAILSAGVRELKTTGELAKLQRKWFGELLRPPLISRQALRWLWIGVGILIGIAALVVFRNWELGRVVQRKTARISALRALGRSFGDVRDIDSVLDRAMEVLDPLMKPEALFVKVDMGVRQVRLAAELVPELTDGFGEDGVVAQVKRQGQPVVLEQLDSNVRLVRSPLLPLGYRSLVCLPVSFEGETLGVLCVLSRRPARFVPKDTDFQQAVASELGIAVANAMLFATLEQRVLDRTRQLNERNEQLEADLDMAREVQVALQPMLNSSAVEIARQDGSEALALSMWNRTSTARTVGGDFFNVLRLSPGTCSVFICDVMGQGARAALLTAIIRTLLDGLTNDAREAQRFLAGLNSRLIDVLKTQETPLFATAFYACFDLAARQVTFANAGHPWPFLMDRSHERVALIGNGEKHGPALGLFPDAPFPQLTRPLTSSETWLLYTDGLYETTNPVGESFGMDRVQELIGQQIKQPLAEVLDGLMVDLTRFSGRDEIDDDVCLLAIEVAPDGVAAR